LRRKLVELEGCLDDEALALEYAAAIGRFAEEGGFNLERYAECYLADLGLSPDLMQRPQATLSGGEQAAVVLATALLSRADLLLLDEPDNHLDLARIQWLKQALTAYDGAVVLVSHDRDLLEGMATHILEVENGSVSLERGPLSAYLSRKQAKLARQQLDYQQQQQHIAELKRNIQRTEERARRFEGMSTNDHWRRIGKKVAKAAVVRKRRLERELDEEHRVEQPGERRRIHLKISRIRTARHLLQLSDVSFSYGKHQLLNDVNLKLGRGDRVAIVGGNGTGKTTLLRIALSQLAPSSGTVWRADMPFFFCDQQRAGLNPQLSALEMLRSACGCSRNKAHHILARLMLRNREALKPVSVLSGGERTRLVLAVLTHLPVGLAVLDEPTNHLDIPSMEVLEQALASYSGGVLLVSHDQRLIASVATDVYALVDGRLVRQ
jgi:ATP-binding cassette subfamily F protein 3